MKKTRIYIASPFFNSAQIAVVEMIERALEDNLLEYFSPMRCPATTQARATGMTPELAAQCFANDIAELDRCSHVVAVNDWLTPGSDPQPMLVRVPTHGALEMVAPLRVPDSGTVWEIGSAYAMGKEIAIYCHETWRNPNLMLAFSTRHIIQGERELRLWLGCFAEAKRGKVQVH